MDKDLFEVATMLVVTAVLGIFAGCVIACESADNRVANQLCQKRQYDFCEISGYKLKGKKNEQSY